ncbi:MAG: hypothetical protein ACO2OT_02775 [Candidatus Caldipriscus sp.]
MRSIYLYIYKWNITQGRPSMKWLWRCKWFYVAYDERERDKFMYVMSELERKEFPFVKLRQKMKIRGLLVVKLLKVRDFLNFWVPNALYDAILSDKRLDSLEVSGMWNVEVWEGIPELIALYEVGKGSTIRTGITELKSRYEELVRGMK